MREYIRMSAAEFALRMVRVNPFPADKIYISFQGAFWEHPTLSLSLSTHLEMDVLPIFLRIKRDLVKVQCNTLELIDDQPRWG